MMNTHFIMHASSKGIMRYNVRLLMHYFNKHKGDKFVLLSRYAKPTTHDKQLIETMQRLNVDFEAICVRPQLENGFLSYAQSILDIITKYPNAKSMFLSHMPLKHDTRKEILLAKFYKDYISALESGKDFELPFYRATGANSTMEMYWYFAIRYVLEHLDKNINIYNIWDDPSCSKFVDSAVYDRIINVFYHRFPDRQLKFICSGDLEHKVDNVVTENTIDYAYFVDDVVEVKPKTKFFFMGMSNWFFKHTSRTKIMYDMLPLLKLNDPKYEYNAKYERASMIDKKLASAYENYPAKSYEYNDYLSELSQSYTTLVVQSYVEAAFSAIRFVEALSRGCVPLVWKESNYELYFDDDLLAVYKKHNLIVEDLTTIKDNIDYVVANYDTVLKEIIECKQYRQYELSHLLNYDKEHSVHL